MAVKTAREMAGLAVVALTDGEKLGKIDDIVFNPSTGQVTGVFVDRGAIFSQPKFLPVGDIQSLGDDALTTSSETAFLDGPSAITGEVPSKKVAGLSVLNPGGTDLGKVADISIDTVALTVPYLILAAGVIANALHGKPQLPLSDVQTIGPDNVIVINSYDPKSA